MSLLCCALCRCHFCIRPFYFLFRFAGRYTSEGVVSLSCVTQYQAKLLIDEAIREQQRILQEMNEEADEDEEILPVDDEVNLDEDPLSDDDQRADVRVPAYAPPQAEPHVLNPELVAISSPVRHRGKAQRTPANEQQIKTVRQFSSPICVRATEKLC